MKESKRERIKLAAAYENGKAISIFAVGAFAPFWANRPRNADEMFPGMIYNLMIFVFMLLVSQRMHLQGRSQLNELDDEPVKYDARAPENRIEKVIYIYTALALVTGLAINHFWPDAPKLQVTPR